LTFEEAKGMYDHLKVQLRMGAINYDRFVQETQNIRLQTPDGVWWQINHQDGSWLKWDGQNWTMYHQDTTGKSPETLAKFLLQILRSLLKGFIKNLPRMILMGVLVLLIHTFLVVGPNGGFAPEATFLSNILALRGQVAGGTIVWMILSWLVISLFTKLKQGQLGSFFGQVGHVPSTIIQAVKQTGNLGLLIMLIFGASSLVLSLLIKNPLACLLLAVVIVVSLSSQSDGIFFTIARLAWSDWNRLFHKNKPAGNFNRNTAIAALGGIAVGFVIFAILPFKPYSIYLLILFSIVLAFVQKSRTDRTSYSWLFLYIGLNIILILCTPANTLADDGGWVESGGNLGSWLRSEGSIRAFLIGLPPALGALVGSLLAGSFGGVALDPAIPLTPSPTPDVSYGAGYPPAHGTVNQQGLVWSEVDGGGWVSKDQFARDQSFLQQGMVYSKEWGWKTPDDLAQTEASRNQHWQEFTSNKVDLNKVVQAEMAAKQAGLWSSTDDIQTKLWIIQNAPTSQAYDDMNKLVQNMTVNANGQTLGDKNSINHALSQMLQDTNKPNLTYNEKYALRQEIMDGAPLPFNDQREQIFDGLGIHTGITDMAKQYNLYGVSPGEENFCNGVNIISKVNDAANYTAGYMAAGDSTVKALTKSGIQVGVKTVLTKNPVVGLGDTAFKYATKATLGYDASPSKLVEYLTNRAMDGVTGDLGPQAPVVQNWSDPAMQNALNEAQKLALQQRLTVPGLPSDQQVQLQNILNSLNGKGGM